MRSTLAVLAAGVAAVVVATLAGGEAATLDAVVRPPTLVRAALVAAFVVGGLALLASSALRLGGPSRDGRDVPAMVRAVRLAFLAVAAFAAAAGWAIGHPLPLIVAAVIAGIDVIETSFLLIVVGSRRSGR
jgi:hypothetical protein